MIARMPSPAAELATTVGAELLRTSLLGTAVPRLDGRYEIRAIIGRGATAVVVRARDTRLLRDTALKLAPTGTVSGMLREARLLAQLHRPRHVVQVWETGSGSLQLAALTIAVDFVAMELLNGISLRTWLATNRPGAEAVVEMFAGVAAGLGEVHALGILHGDVKPDNIVVDPEGVPLLVDFGFANVKAIVASARPREVVGTDGYLAPEARGGNPEQASDVYAFAVSMWEAFTGTLPFRRAGLATTWFARVRPLRRQRLVPRAMRPVLRRALSDDPALRPSAGELKSLLAAPPRSRVGRVTFVVLAMVLVALALTGAWGYVQYGPRLAPRREAPAPVRLARLSIDASVPTPAPTVTPPAPPIVASPTPSTASRAEAPHACTPLRLEGGTYLVTTTPHPPFPSTCCRGTAAQGHYQLTPLHGGTTARVVRSGTPHATDQDSQVDRRDGGCAWVFRADFTRLRHDDRTSCGARCFYEFDLGPGELCSVHVRSDHRDAFGGTCTYARMP